MKRLTPQEKIDRLKTNFREIIIPLIDQYAMDMHNLLSEWEEKRNEKR